MSLGKQRYFLLPPVVKQGSTKPEECQDMGKNYSYVLFSWVYHFDFLVEIDSIAEQLPPVTEHLLNCLEVKKSSHYPEFPHSGNAFNLLIGWSGASCPEGSCRRSWVGPACTQKRCVVSSHCFVFPVHNSNALPVFRSILNTLLPGPSTTSDCQRCYGIPDVCEPCLIV